MRILHYSLGFPPFRTGGLTKFCMDLMLEQIREGHDVSLLWPGEIRLINKKTIVKNRGFKQVDQYQIGSFEVINPIPVSYDEGISDIALFTKDGDKKAYSDFLDTYRPDVIHLHTFMGLHRSFISSAKEKGIRLVFTTHDFFPICPKVTLFRNGTICSDAFGCESCPMCNSTALSLKKMQILQSPIYRTVKDSSVVKKMRKKHRDEYLGEETDNHKNEVPIVASKEDYLLLRSYYESMLKMVDVIQYNSTVSKKVYENFFGRLPNQVITITHSDIKDRRKKRSYSDDLIRIRYLGSCSSHKGFFYLKNALDKLYSEKQNFCLDVHFEYKEAVYIQSHERYSYDELEHIFDETDVLVAPSLWYETFGYTILEALSFGVPVITTCNVGAKDIIAENAGIIVNDLSGEELYETFSGLTAAGLEEMNHAILENQTITLISEFARTIDERCYH